MEFVKKTAKVTRGKITDGDAEVVCQAFRSNNIHGSSLAQLDDTDWRQLIPNVGVRRELQAATARKIKDEEIALRTALFFKGRPVKPVDEVPALRALPKITSYFTPASNNVLDLPEETLPNITIDEFKKNCESQQRYLYLTKGGLTPKFQIMDCAPNAIVHKYVTSQNMLRMLSAKTDSRGYPVCMNRVELASSVDQGWASVNPGLIMRCALSRLLLRAKI